ncbi:phBC6A51 family helix-turn-helix protein [Dyadobacter sp. 3J3]|uniref:phBC6A51 family helix-turn-helix protein n=1 Tax=Dyadobacter sp. 3J3 TaxID=2606600 RepID=UPI00135B9B0D|nr:phBC6A51 family helix-turn-helix protein [Dyadobacter sp. 3J3]
MKYSKTIVNRICQLIESDSYTITEICKIVGISKSTYHEWAKKSDFSDLLASKRSDFEDLLVVEAKRSLMKKIRGYTATEIKTVTVPSKVDGEPVMVKEKILTEKQVAPDTVALIFLLTNKAPEEYKHRQTVEAKIENRIGQLSDSQINKVIDQVLNSNSDGN